MAIPKITLPQPLPDAGRGARLRLPLPLQGLRGWGVRSFRQPIAPLFQGGDKIVLPLNCIYDDLDKQTHHFQRAEPSHPYRPRTLAMATQ